MDCFFKDQRTVSPEEQGEFDSYWKQLEEEIVKEYMKTEDYAVLKAGLNTAEEAIEEGVYEEDTVDVNTEDMNINNEIFEW